MTHMFKSPNAIVGTKCRSMYRLWKDIAGGRFAPRRDEMSLRLVRGLAQWLWMADVIDGGADFRIRLLGHQVTRLYGHGLQGTALSECPDILFFRTMRRCLVHCVNTRAPFACGPSQSEYPGREHLEIEYVALPLSDDGTAVTDVAGTLQYWQLGTNAAAGRLGENAGEERTP